MNTKEEELTFDYTEIRAETPAAILLRFDVREIWFPKSSGCEIDREDKTIYVPQWLAEKKELI